MGTDESRAKSKALATEASDRFLVARDPTELLSSVSALKTNLSPNLAALAAAFEQNISAVAATVGIPVTLASGASEGSHWQRIHSAERIRALKLEAEPREDKAALSPSFKSPLPSKDCNLNSPWKNSPRLASIYHPL